MKFKKNTFDKALAKSRPNNDKVVVSSEYYQNDRPVYLCSFCNQTLSRLTDAGLNNSTHWCRNRSVEWDPLEENLRKESKITVPDRNTEPAITSIQTNMADEVEIHHTVPKRGGFAELEKKGIKTIILRKKSRVG